MGSPLNGVFVRVFIKSDPFKFIVPKDSRYFRYIDDILFIHQRNNGWAKITNDLNKIEPRIDFTFQARN